MAKILVVDDEDAIRELILMNLSMVGHEGVPACDGNEAMDLIKNDQFALCLLDVMLPEQDGFSLLDGFIKAGIPVIFLTVKSGLNDRVKGLKLGAQDYIVKPFETLELLARIEVVLRRAGKSRESFHIGDVYVDFQERRVTKGCNPVDLTALEYALHKVLVRNRNLAMSREKLLNAAWGYEYAGETVDMHIQRLRKKLDLSDAIKTVYKYGYRLEVQ